MLEKLDRVVVVGTSCCGKTDFARRLAQALHSQHVELDELFWGPNWTPKPSADFRRMVELAATGPHWVADGNYGSVRDSLATVLIRGLRRTIRRIISREPLFAGNRESIRRAFFARDSILLWVITTYHRRRKDYESLRSNEFRELHWIEFRRPAEAEAFLSEFRMRGASLRTKDAPT
jgi:adenylate kinase family enzyme